MLPSLVLLFAVTLLFFSNAPSASSAIVKTLPGFDGFLPFHLETGYITVDEENNGQLFYYFIKSERNPEEDPLLTWISGGPGCSSFFGLAFEIGPLHFDIKKYDGEIPKLVLHPYSWTKVSNILFIDIPIGAGFSFARGSEPYMGGDIKSSKQVYKFIRKWLDEHPQFLLNPLYIGGDSYSGKLIPVITNEVIEDIEAGLAPPLNLKGYVIGNPIMDPRLDTNALIPYVHRMGFISDELYESAMKSCMGDFQHFSNLKCANDINVICRCISGINEQFILEPKCLQGYFDCPTRKLNDRRSLMDRSIELTTPSIVPNPKCREYGYLLVEYWANNETVREALHTQKGMTKAWEYCTRSLPYVTDIPSGLPYLINISTRGYHALLYSGDHDMVSTYLVAQEALTLLNSSIVDDWRPWSVDGQVAGFTRSYANNLTFALIKGGGHTTPENRPEECYAMFERWISHKPL
ncbi:Serine carboxypeptidase-like 18 [Acorus calamus]|uniref:Serine carboxypeptidase-like 18 n=1 Tax=Acorus calamus TaxID=4465 RepID=A0AAV9DB28_ACOCL|nr:Serine carboxypeptidase-like 18 [Acorus calamus]